MKFERDPLNTQHAQHRPVQATDRWEQEEEVVFTLDFTVAMAILHSVSSGLILHCYSKEAVKQSALRPHAKISVRSFRFYRMTGGRVCCSSRSI